MGTRLTWVTDRMHPVDMELKRNKRVWAKRRGGGRVLATSIYHADVMVVSSSWPVAKAIKAHVHAEAKARAEIAAGVLRANRDTGNSKIEVRQGAVDTSVFLRDPLRTDERGRQIGGAAWAVEGQTQALGKAFDTQFVRKLDGWKEMFPDESS